MTIPDSKRHRITNVIVALLAVTLLAGLGLFGLLTRELVAAWSMRPAPVIVPATATATPQPAPTETSLPAPSATSPPAPTETASRGPEPCSEGLQDPGFEAGSGWKILDTAYQAGYVGSEYVTSPVRSGRRALRLGITEGKDYFSYSSAEQTLTIPADVAAARLSFWVRPVSTDTVDDLQYVLLINESGRYEQLMWEMIDTPDYQRREVSLDAYRGQRVTVRFGVKNDGDGERTAMYVDDVSLTLCKGVTPTPYP